MSSMGWAYPPGVSGSEPQIAGLDEDTREVECDRATQTLYAEEVRAVVRDLAIRLDIVANNLIGGNVTWRESADTLHRLAARSRSDLSDLPEAGEVDCDFAGRVEGEWVDRWTFAWECPRCGADHEDEIDDVDPDAGRDD